MQNGISPVYPPGAVIMAPLSGYTDLPYRRAMRRHGCRFAFTEMVDVASLAFSGEKGRTMLLRGDDEDFLGCQLVGSNPDYVKRAIEIVDEYDFDVLDFNLGCPVAKVAKKGAGAELGRHIDRALEIFSLFRASKHPLSAKIRILSETDPEPTVRLVRGLAGLGARTVTIHGRIKEMFYSGPVFFDIIREAANRVPEVQIIGNGGIMTREQAAEMREKTGCDGIMLARGAMGNPWLFSEIADGDAYLPPTIAELLAEVERHIAELVELYSEAPAMRMARKIVHDYFRGRGFAGPFRSQASYLATFDDLRRFLDQAPAAHADSYFTQSLRERRLRP